MITKPLALRAPARRAAIVAEGAGAVALYAHGAAGGALLAGVPFAAGFAAEASQCRGSLWQRGKRRVAHRHFGFLGVFVAELFYVLIFADRLRCNSIRSGNRNLTSAHAVRSRFIHRFDMDEILTAKILVAKCAEDVIQNACRVLDRFVSLHLTGRFET